MIKATLKHINTHTETEKIELPDTVNTGDIICVVYHAMGNFDYDDCMDMDTFEIALEDGRVYHCYEVVINKYRLYVEYVDEEGFEYDWIADFMLKE